MPYAFVKDEQLVAYDVFFPREALSLVDGTYIRDLRGASVQQQQECGFWEIVEVTPPSVTDTQRLVRDVELVNGVPTEVWSVREETVDELRARIRKENALSLSDVQAGLALIDAGDEFIDWIDSTPVQNVLAASRDMTLAELSAGIRKIAPQLRNATILANKLARLRIGEEALDSTENS